jgi:hypothetical protein
LLGLSVVLGKVTGLPAIEARVSGGCRLLWWPGCHLLLLRCRRGADVLLLLLLEQWVIALELRRSAWLSCGWRVNHAVLQGAPLELPSDDPGISLFLFLSSATSQALIVLSWSIAAVASSL